MNATVTHSDPIRPTAAAPVGAPGGADVLALGFGTTVAMWAVGYIGWAFADVVPGWCIAAAMFACLVAGGFLTGRLTTRGWRGGLLVGLLVAALNLLILGSLVHEGGDYAPPLAVWLPGAIFGMCAVAAMGSVVGSAFRNPQPTIRNPNWTFRFALVAIAATGLLLLAGGLVTGREAGLAVPDWPRSYGYNMFFYPLTKMKGNIYYEHAHRLLGSLVGLTTIALAVHLWLTDRQRSLRVLALAAVVAVIAQGMMGGYRVALADGSGAQVATPQNETAASTTLRVAHGVAAQLFLALIVAIAAMTSRTWFGHSNVPRRGGISEPVSMGRALSALLLALLLIQLILGALLRHLNAALMLHITFAAMVFLAALAAGMQVLATHGRSVPALRRLALALLAIVTLQVLLGITALIFRAGADAPGGLEPTIADVASTTAHQLTGAALLAIATALALLVHRLSPASGVTATADGSIMFEACSSDSPLEREVTE